MTLLLNIADLPRSNVVVIAPEIVANISRGWNCAPAGFAEGTKRTGVSVALWESDKQAVLELSGVSDCHLVTVQLQPTGTVEITSDRRRKTSGPFCHLACDITQAGETSEAIVKGPVEILQFYIPPDFVADLLEGEGIASTSGSIELVDPQGQRDPVISRICLDAALEIRRPQAFSKLKIDTLGQELVIHLLRAHSNLCSKALDRGRGSLSPQQVRRITDFLEENLCEDVSLDDLARLAGLSRYHICRAFKQATGLPPHRWVLTRRIERAQALLSTTDLSVTSIALQFSFSSSQHFAVTFRNLTGLSPSQFRAQQRTWSV